MADDRDRCPDAAGPPDNYGCPDRDSDGDGVVDRLDRCPAEAGPVGNAGCPPRDTDGDGDGIIDRTDKCPTQPESPNGYQDEDGCPDEVPTKLKQFAGTIEGIVFKTGSAEIDPKSFPILKKAAGVFKESPVVMVEIQGHTDNQGDAGKNIDLSKRRAEAVKTWLVKNGIDGGRLSSEGFGPNKPIADNGSEPGRQRNRRVEFKLK